MMTQSAPVDWLSARATSSPDALALVSAGERWTYAQLQTAASDDAGRLRGLGVVRGQKVAVLLPNGPTYVRLIHAAARLGLVLIPLNTRLTAAEIAWQLKHTGCDLLLYDAALLPQPELLTEYTGRRYTLAEFQAMKTDAPVTSSSLSFDAPLAIVFTSGTSGRPKGAVLTVGNFFYSAMASAYHLGTLPDDRWLCVLPLYHVGGLSIIIRACLYGISVDLHERFDLETVGRALRNDPITLVSLVPTMLYRLLNADAQPWNAHLRLVLLGGAAASPELIALCRARGIPAATTYGLTEAASQVATAQPQHVIQKPGSVGKPLPFTTVRILGEDGQPLPAGQVGEVVVSGPTVMQGYYADATATQTAVRVDGSLYTGDMGYLDSEGDLWVVQRRSDLIISGGENIYPAEVEAALRQHPAVGEAVVVGLADAEWGQRVAAAIVLKPGYVTTPEALMSHCRQHLAGYKQPRILRIVDALPLTAAGKIQRSAVPEMLQ